MNAEKHISGQLVDVHQRRIYPARISIAEGRIHRIQPVDSAHSQFIMPGFIDAHIHIESSMLVPSAFARMAVLHGTVATVSDPHEIANVCGCAGVDYMIENAAKVPLKFFFGAPSCVPATPFETAGAVISPDDITMLLQRPEIKYLAEMMNFPGVLMRDEQVMQKLQAARSAGKPVDGHAPGLHGAVAARYAAEGISTDHECFTLEEALDKLAAGMIVIIREGSAAKNFDALQSLLQSHPGKVMFCSDDKHPDDLIKGHINKMVQRALHAGYNLFDVLHAACELPVRHYGLEVGLLREGDSADCIVVDNLQDINVLQTYINGQLVADKGHCLFEAVPAVAINQFAIGPKDVSAFQLKVNRNMEQVSCPVIEALDGQLITRCNTDTLPVKEGLVRTDVERDLLKIVVVNRYQEAEVAVGFIKNFGLKRGALASSVAHDSHNIVCVGVTDEAIAAAVNAIVESKGGISVFDGVRIHRMALPVAGLMSLEDASATASAYESLDAAAKSLGCRLHAPFMTLSFMALPVIPSLKMTDKGLFDVDAFAFRDVLPPTARLS
jgi:adenine deaminase